LKDETFQKTFTICQRHLDYLESKDKHASKALRKELDIAMKKDSRFNKKEVFNQSLNLISFGLILLLFSYIITSFSLKIICMGLGAFLLGYGTLGGLKDVLQKP